MINKRYLLSIIIPTQNRPKLLKQFIKEFTKTGENIELIIVFNGDYKNNFFKIKNFINKKNIKIVKINKKITAGNARNIGMKLSQSKYVWFLDDDDFINYIQIKKIYFKLLHISFYNLFFVTMKKKFDNAYSELISPDKSEFLNSYLKDKFQRINTSCIIFKRKDLLKINGWDNHLPSGQDTDLLLRFSSIAKPFKLSGIFMIVNYASQNRITTDFKKQMIGKYYFLKKNWLLITFKKRLYYILSLILFFPMINKFRLYLKIK